MKNEKILEMINNGDIVLLKVKIKEEIYEAELKKLKGSNAHKRFMAMKRYFKYSNDHDDRLNYPGTNLNIKIFGKEGNYNCFCDGYSLALTSEEIGEMVDFKHCGTTNDLEYFNVQNMLNTINEYTDILVYDLNNILSKAKSEGYRYKKSELDSYKFMYAMCYKETYYKIGLLDKAFNIINDGRECKIYYINKKSPLYIVTSVGVAIILPINMKDEKGKIILNLDEQNK